MPFVYAELHELAGRYMASQGRGHTLQPTALVHEAWLRLAREGAGGLENRKQFFALASKAMRSVLVDHARARSSEKRDGGRVRLTLSVEPGGPTDSHADVLVVEECLGRLAERDPELARIVELRFFGWLDYAEIAEATGTTPRSAEYGWRMARAWLHRELSR